ncbi:hypothetical protein B0H10DRAFT_906787 [Mycena sp. CBHHK59/15]|nr:hypothetical protein B0H10DRAFT_906787 [Mycena sp. CBHHK59/15]
MSTSRCPPGLHNQPSVDGIALRTQFHIHAGLHGKGLPAREDPHIRQAWLATPNVVVEPKVQQFSAEIDDPVRIAGNVPVPADIRVDYFGQISAYDTGMPAKESSYPRFLNPTAPEFYPSESRYISTSTSGPFSQSGASRSASHVCIPEFPDNPGAEHAYQHYHRMLFKYYRTGMSTVLRSLLREGIKNGAAAHVIAHIAHRLTAGQGHEVLKSLIRSESIGMFHLYWQPNGPWTREPCVANAYLNAQGVKIAAFLGSLYSVGILGGGDAHHAIEVLFAEGPNFSKLLAAHALFAHCGDRICSGRDAVRTVMLRDHLAQRYPNGTFIWGPTELSHVLITVCVFVLRSDIELC